MSSSIWCCSFFIPIKLWMRVIILEVYVFRSLWDLFNLLKRSKCQHWYQVHYKFNASSDRCITHYRLFKNSWLEILTSHFHMSLSMSLTYLMNWVSWTIIFRPWYAASIVQITVLAKISQEHVHLWSVSVSHRRGLVVHSVITQQCSFLCTPAGQTAVSQYSLLF